jgi:hypothetical protein
MHVAPAWSGRRRGSCSERAFSGDTQVAPRRSDAILEALRPCTGGPAGVDGAVATMTTIVATSGPSLQVHVVHGTAGRLGRSVGDANRA